MLEQFNPVLRIRIRKILASCIRIRKNMRIQGVKYQPKTAKKNILHQNPKSELLKKDIIKISSILNGSSSFRIKIKEKNKTKNC